MPTQTGSIELKASKKLNDTTAKKSEAIANTVPCYYRSSSSTAPNITTATSIGTNKNTDNAWEYVMPVPSKNKYFFTCERYIMVDGSTVFSDVQPLDSETYASKWVSGDNPVYIDGGSLYANSVTADQIAAESIATTHLQAGAVTANTLASSAVIAGKIAAGAVVAGSIAASAVAADNIQADAITAQKIASTAVTADKIAAGSITIGKINQSDANTANAILNSNINIGGKNILKDSEYMNTGWLFGSGATKSDDIITLVGSSSDWNSVIHSVKFKTDIYDGITPLVFSFDIKSSADCSIQIVASGSSSLPDASTTPRTKYVNWQTPAVVQSTGGVWKRYETSSRTIAISQLTNGSGTVNSGFIQIYARTSNTNIQIRHIQLEQGNISTDWSPAPEDFFDGIDEAAKTATDYLIDIDSKAGIKVQPAASTINYLQMNASDIRFVKDNVDVVNLTTNSLRIGAANSKHTVTDSNGFHVWTGSQATATNEVAVFGSTARIGTSSGARVVTTSTGMEVYNSSNQKKLSLGTGNQYIYGGNATYPLVQASSSGIKVAQSSTNYNNLTSSGLEVFQGGNSVANFGSTARIGTTSGPYVQTSSSSVKIAKDANNYSNISTGGLEVFQGGNSVANFSSVARIGTASGARVVTSSTGVNVYNKDNQLKASFTTAGQYIYGGSGTYPYVQPTTDLIKVAQSSTNYAEVTSNGMEIIQNGKSVANFSSVTRLGTTAGPKVQINSNGTTVYKDANNKVNMTGNGLEVIQGGNSVASFGSSARIGTTSGPYVQTSSSAIKVAKDSNNYSNISTGGLEVFQGGNSIASFSSAARIGAGASAHSIIDSNGQRFYASDGETQLANIGYGPGAAETTGTTATKPYYTFGTRKNNSGIGNYSFVEGFNNEASGYDSHAEGSQTVASGWESHAEGIQTVASGDYSHAGGDTCETYGQGSFAHGRDLQAYGTNQFVIGKLNRAYQDSNFKSQERVFIIGNGENYNRQNCFQVGKDGNIWMYINSTEGEAEELYSSIESFNWQDSVIYSNGGRSPIQKMLSLKDLLTFFLDDYYESVKRKTVTWTRPTVSSSAITYPASQAGGYYIEGKRCYIQMRCTLASQLAKDSARIIATGLPLPESATTDAPLTILVNNRGGHCARVYKANSSDTTGSLQIIADYDHVMAASALISICGVYTIA